MCMGGGTPSAPPPSPVAPPPIQVDEAGMQGREAERRRRAQAAGSASTILTSPSGTQGNTQTTSKTLLGA